MLTPKELIAAGIKPGELFGRILKGCETIEEAIAVWDAGQPIKVHKSIKIIEDSAWSFVCGDLFRNMSSREFDGTASNGEKRRWLENGAVVINNKKAKPDDILEFPITQLVFFPNSDKNRVTMI